jgi:predicted outer membrane protein
MERLNIFITGLAVMLLLSIGSAYAQQTLTLEASKRLTLENNTSVKNGKLEVEAAKQTRKAAFGLLPFH